MGCAPYDEFLCTWSRRGHWRRCAAVVAEMRAVEIRPSAEALCSCCVCFVECERWALVVSTLDSMRADGVAPAAGMFRALDSARRCVVLSDTEDGSRAHNCDVGTQSSSHRGADYAAAMGYLFLEEPPPLDVQFEDADIIVVNKPVGCVVQPGRAWKYWSGTLAHAVLARCCRPGEPHQNPDWRPTVVHRLDKGTSGIMVLAKTHVAACALRQAFAERSVDRVYHALLYGCLSDSEDATGGRLETCIGPDLSANSRRMAALPLAAAATTTAKFAASHYRCLERLAGGYLSLAEFKLETGRTHQVRVHAAHLGCPLAGDDTYDPMAEDRVMQAVEAGATAIVIEVAALMEQQGLLLHAGQLGFAHPRSGEWMRFAAPRPAAFERVVGLLAATCAPPVQAP